MTTTETNERIGAAIEARAISLGIKWRPLARRLDISISYLNQIRNGQRRPSPAVASRIEDVLDWEHGSIAAIAAGGEPTVRKSRPAPAATVADDPYRQAVREIVRDMLHAELGRKPTRAEVIRKMNSIADNAE